MEPCIYIGHTDNIDKEVITSLIECFAKENIKSALILQQVQDERSEIYG